MKVKELAFLSLRVLSIYLFIQALYHLVQLINLSIIPQIYNQIFAMRTIILISFVSIIPFLLLGLFSIILWKKSDKLTNYIIPNGKETDEIKITQTGYQLQTIAFSVIGLILLANTLPEISNLIPSIIQINTISTSTISDHYLWQVIFSLVEKGLKLLIGFYLLVGSRGLVGFIRRLREI